jgi:glutathione synthase/RimK-type ligase-like ATP-grasp enzyme
LILIITNRNDYTTDFVISRLMKYGVNFTRFNTEDFPFDATISLSKEGKRLELRKSNRRIDLSEVHSVWYRRPNLPAFPSELDEDSRDFVSRESREFLMGLWRSLPCLWVNHPDKIRLSENKIEQLQRASQSGFLVPDTVVTNDPAVATDFYRSHNGRIIGKTLRQSYATLGSAQYVIYTNPILEEHLVFIDSVRFSPVIFQELVGKASDIRVTIVESEVFATEIHSQESDDTHIDWRRDTLQSKHTIYRLPEDVEDQCLKLVESYGLTFGAIDLIRTPGGQHVFLELNPNGQWAWLEAMTGQAISDKLIEVLKS